MSNSLPSPSKMRIDEVTLTSYDGRVSERIDLLVTEINFSQSIEAAAYNGSIKITDNVGMLEDFPIRGEERLTIVLSSNDTDTKKTLDLQVYKADNITINDANDGLGYYLHFVSRISFEASKRRIVEPIRDGTFYPSASGMVKKIFKKYFSPISDNNAISLPFAGQRYGIGNTERSFIVQPTEGQLNGIIPNYSPTEAMYFLSTRAYVSGQGFTSCSFRFFETLDDFYFVSDEYLISYANRQNEILKLVYAPQISKDPRDIAQQILSVEKIHYPNRVDTADDMYSGGYMNRVIEIDLTRRTVNSLDSQHFSYLDNANFLDMNGAPHTPESYIHTEKFTRDTFTRENAKRYIVFKDYSSAGSIPSALNSDQFIRNIIQQRTSYNHHINSTAINVSLRGRLDIKPGSVVNLEIQELNSKSNRSKNRQLSGNYLVHTANHSIQLEELKTNLRLIKYDWST